jgi:hypothetical protein
LWMPLESHVTISSTMENPCLFWLGVQPRLSIHALPKTTWPSLEERDSSKYTFLSSALYTFLLSLTRRYITLVSTKSKKKKKTES